MLFRSVDGVVARVVEAEVLVRVGELDAYDAWLPERAAEALELDGVPIASSGSGDRGGRE